MKYLIMPYVIAHIMIAKQFYFTQDLVEAWNKHFLRSLRERREKGGDNFMQK